MTYLGDVKEVKDLKEVKDGPSVAVLQILHFLQIFHLSGTGSLTDEQWSVGRTDPNALPPSLGSGSGQGRCQHGHGARSDRGEQHGHHPHRAQGVLRQTPRGCSCLGSWVRSSAGTLLEGSLAEPRRGEWSAVYSRRAVAHWPCRCRTSSPVPPLAPKLNGWTHTAKEVTITW